MSDIQRSQAPLCKILGVHLEGPFLNPSRCGALDPAFFLLPKEHYLKEIIEGFEDIVKIITIAPELDGAVELIEIITDSGIAANMGHSDATFTEAEKGFLKGAKGITHLFNAMRGFHHREPGIAGFAMVNPHIFVEVIADPFHLHPKVLELIFKIKDPSKIVIISDSVRDTYSAKFSMPKSFNRRQAEGIRDARGVLQGGTATVTDAAHLLIERGFNKEIVLRCISDNPATFLGYIP